MRFLRILAALTMLPMAWQFHTKASVTTDTALDAPRTLDKPLPADRAGDFFGQSSRELLKKPQVQQQLASARLAEFAALLCCIACPLLFVSAFIRRRPQPEPSCESPQPQ